MCRPRTLAAILVVMCWFGIPPVLAQQPLFGSNADRGEKTTSAVAQDSLASKRDRTAADEAPPDSPRGAVAGYLMAARAGDYERAADYMDVSAAMSGDHSEGPALLARQLKCVLDRELWIDLDALSDRPQGDLEDGLSPDRESIGAIMTRQGRVEVRLRRTEDAAAGRPVWRFSPRLVERIPELYAEFGPGPIGDRMPPALYRPRFLEIELWQWLGLILTAAIAYGIAALITGLIFWWARYQMVRRNESTDNRFLKSIRREMRLALALGIFLLLAIFAIRLPIPARRVLFRIGEVFLIFLVGWTLIKLSGVLWSTTRERLQREDRRSAVALAILGERLTKAALAALSVIVVLQQIGFNVTGILAGVGVGGVAVALAAQKTIANLFGGFSLATDQPVRLGDFCRFGDKSGWVEEIGMRSTRIRTLDRSIISVPNSEFAEVQLENLSLRDRMRLIAEIGLRYETQPDQLRHVLAGLRTMLAEDPRVIQDPLRVRFVGFGPYSLQIEVMTYIATSDTDTFLGIREELYLKMMDVVQECGTGFAFPSQTIYAAQDPGLDPDRAFRAGRPGQAGDAVGRSGRRSVPAKPATEGGA
jgi:MscS family membrane protein